MPKPQKLRQQDEYGMEGDDATPQGSSASLAKLTKADIDQLAEDEGPQKKKRRPKMEWQLFLGGFLFPWTPGAVMQWLLIAIWAAAAGWLTRSAIALGIKQGLGDVSMYQTIVAMLAAMGAIIAGVGCAAIAAIHGLTILLETTAGNDRMENWPNVGLFLEWIGQLFFVINPVVITVALGLGLDWLLPEVLGSREMMVAVTVFFVFPILLLCSLETDSPFLPVSTVVLGSLGRHAIPWLAFFLQSGCLLAAAAAMVCYWGSELDPRLGIPLAGLLFSAILMIYFRLLGRLAFYCSVEPEEEEEEVEE